MLLACGPCNLAKSNKPVDFITYYFPEEHNTILPFRIRANAFNSAAFVEPNIQLTPYQFAKAQVTIDLTHLNTTDHRKDIVVIRWKKRNDAIKAVFSTHEMYIDLKVVNGANAAKYADNVAKIAMGIGFFSLWFEKFYNEPLVIEQLILQIPGTAVNCFDPANGFIPINRNIGNATDPF